MLRVLSEVYSAKSSIPNNLITATVTRTFLDKKLEKSANPDADRTFLSTLGKVLFEKNQDLVFEDEVSAHSITPNFLIEYGILRRTKDDLGRSLIGFQYDHIRDFVMCFFSLKLDTLSESDLGNIVGQNIHADIPRSVFYYYEKIAQDTYKTVIRKEFSQYHFKRAEEFIKAYQNILDTEFSVIRELFEPYSKNIGLLVFYSLNYLHAQYSFREVKEGETKVIWLERENWYDKELEKEIIQISLKHSLRGRVIASHDFTVKDPLLYARERIVLQLKHLIEARALFEDNNLLLMIEYILQETSKRAFSWHLSNELYNDGFNWKRIVPLNLNMVIGEVKNGLAQIDSSCKSLGFVDYELPPNELRLYYYAQKVQTTQEKIAKNPLPFPQNVRIPVDVTEIDKFTDEEMVKYLSTLFLSVLDEYKALVEFNFPELKNSLRTYNQLPINVVGEIEKQGDHFSAFNYCFIHSEKNSVEIRIKGQESIFDYKNRLVTTNEGKVRLNGYSRCIIWLFFENDSGRQNIIQKRVYEMLYQDFKGILNWDII